MMTFLVLDIRSVFCVLKFLSVFIVFVLIHVQMLIFHCSVVILRTRLLCAFYNE